MQTYDFIMLAVMGISVFIGLRKGFAWQVASIASIFVSYFVSRNFAGIVAGQIGGDPAWNKFLAMFILFFGSSLLIWILFGFVRNTIERWHLKSFDSQVGAAMGAAKGALLCIIITLFGVSLLGDSVRQSICTSRSGNYVAHALARLKGIVPPEIDRYIGPYVERFNNEMNVRQGGAGNSGLVANNPAPAFPNFGFNPGQLPGNPLSAPANTGTWQPPMEQIGNLFPVQPASSNASTWQGQLRQVDIGQAAGEIIDSLIRNNANRREP
jgi:membrane protein required for colicin V production